MTLDRQRVIGVITPYTGGFYYGAILEGVQRACGLRAASVFALQTSGLQSHWPNEGKTLAIDVADAWIVANEATTDPYVDCIIRAQRPMAFVNAQRSDIEVCSVLPDNVGGMREAVAHLIGHGHRRIAFAGFAGQIDIRERYEGYVQAHRDAGLTPAEELLLWSTDNRESDGHALGNRLVSLGSGFTAVVAATDKFALAVIRVLRAAGYRIPQDVAVVGFDDIEQAQYAEPPLTTVRQTFQAVAATATNALLDHLEHETVLPATIRVPVTFVQRQSCGCATSNASFDKGLQGPKDQAEQELTLALLRVAGTSLARPATEAEWPGARLIAERLRVQLDGNTAASLDLPTELWAGFLQLNRDAEAIDRMTSLLESFIGAWTEEATNIRCRRIARDLRISLLRSWQGAEQRRIRLYEFVAESSARINNALATARTDGPPDIGWLRFTHAQYGCLGLWKRDASGNRYLEIVSEHNGQPHPVNENTNPDAVASKSTFVPLLSKGDPTTFAPEGFPSRKLCAALQALSRHNLVTIVPLKSRSANHGLLLVAAPVALELIDHVGSIGDWGERIGQLLDQVRVEQRLREDALTDGLTGLPNRAALVAHLNDLSGQRGNPTVAVLLLDLDDFKKVNDSLGHPAGDSLLIEVAQRLRTLVEPHHMVVRLGGDEFVVVLEDATSDQPARETAAQIQEALRLPIELPGDIAFVSCSIGIVLPDQPEFSAAELLRDADTAMHRAKMLGSSRHEVFHHGMREQALERQRLDVHLRQALSNNEFELAYQPIVSLHNGAVVGAEALIRWNHPEQGYLSPGRFLAVAEEVGMIIPIGEWVLRTACRHAAAWQRYGRSVYVNVNVAVPHLQQPGFVAFTRHILAETGLAPALLGLELVENSLVSRVDIVTRTLSELMQLGVRVAVDDFGTGYSSLSYLKNLPVSSLKLDRSFINGIPVSVSNTAIVSAVLTMGRGLGLSVVAEGVESEEQLEFLLAEGCELAQGYYFSRPLSRVAWEARLRSAAGFTLPATKHRYAGDVPWAALDR